MRRFVLALCLLPSAALAENWVVLEGAALREALEGRVVTYESGAWQDFRASGRTLYNAGRDSWGYWALRDDQYCSMWPPSDLWACYDVARQGNRIKFIGEGGDETVGDYKE